MNRHQFSIGMEFNCGGKQWRCIDIGSRVITAVCLSDHPKDPSWFNGPPYAVAEVVFDEDDLEECLPAAEAPLPGMSRSSTEH